MKNRIPPLSNYRGNQTFAEEGDSVIALHCSGGNSRQWRGIEQILNDKFEVLTPEHYGTSPNRIWPNNRMLSMADEAELSLQLIDQSRKNVHLVGHSYGGALALQIALARPDRISSISLYEPCAFHLLTKLGARVTAETSEISGLAAAISLHINEGDHWRAMQGFVDYWSGEGAWLKMKPAHRDYLIDWAPNAINEFDALFNEDTALSEYQGLDVPVQLLQGDCSPMPVQLVSVILSQLLPDCRINRLPGVGHMGPLTHADTVNRIIVAHIQSHSTGTIFPPYETSVQAQKIAAAA